MKIEIKVTKEILIRSANCRNHFAFNCAISLAIRDLFPTAAVAVKEIRYLTPLQMEECLTNSVIDTNFVTSPLPFKAQEFIALFDPALSYERVLMEPISFEIDVPEEVIQEIGVNEAIEIINRSQTLELA